MSSNAYWERRQAQRMFEHMQSAEKAADEMAELYHKAALYLDLSIDDIFERYRTKHHLTEQQAKELLKNLPDNSTIQELKRALKNDKYNKHKQEFLKELESPAYESRIRRLEYMRLQIDDMMENVYQQEKQSSMSHYISLAGEAYYKSLFEMQKRTGLGFGFSHASQQVIERVINSKWLGQNYSSRIWSNTKTLAETVKQELLLGLVTGKTNREVAKDIELQFAVGANKARRLVRTESNYLCGQMAMESYKAAGIEKYRFLATLDLRTSKVCRSLDGKVFLVSEQQPGKNCNPMHPWCRSTTISIIDAETLSMLKRSALDPSTGKTITVPADMTYEQWYRKFVMGDSQARHQEKKIKNLSADCRKYEQYKEVLKDNLPKTLDDFQDMKYNKTEKWKYTKLDYQRRHKLMEHPELKLPNAGDVILPKEKFTKYLFGGENEKGLAKGRAFTDRLGYDMDSWKEFQKEIKIKAAQYPAAYKDNNGYGDRYEQKMIIYGKKDTPANVIVGWIHRNDGSVAMTSAYIKEVKGE